MFNWKKHSKIVRVMVVSVTALLAAVGVKLVAGGDGHDAEAYITENYEDNEHIRVDVCPSAEEHLPGMMNAAETLREIGYPYPPVQPSSCVGEPELGVVQVRGHRDLMSNYVAPMLPNSVDRMARHLDTNTGVAYLLGLEAIKDCTHLHLSGHIAGFGGEHFSAATSFMADPCGDSVFHLDRTKGVDKP